MEKYYLAVDIGASSGRHMLAGMKDGKMQLEEVYRFPNGMDNKNGTLCWDVDRLITEIKNGLKKCKEIGKIPVSMGIDTWGVDYVLLDKDDNILGDTVGYRDSRTEGMDEKVYEVIPQDDLYARTGIQKQIFNTIYQLMGCKAVLSGISGAGGDDPDDSGLFQFPAHRREDERVYGGYDRTADQPEDQ